MKVKDIMTKEVVSISTETSTKEAAAKMRGKKIGSLLVLDEEEKLVGIVTDRIIALSVVADGLNPKNVLVKDIMSENIISVSPEMELAKAAKLLEELEIRYLPVTINNKIMGILSVSDIASFVQDYIECIFVELGSRVEKKKAKD